MVAAPLVESKIEEGRRLVRILDESDFQLSAALWLFSAEMNWRLMLATRLFDSVGPRETYRKLQRILSWAKPTVPILLNEIQVVSPRDDLIRFLREAIQTGPKLTEIRFTGNTVNGIYIDDAYIYRLT